MTKVERLLMAATVVTSVTWLQATEAGIENGTGGVLALVGRPARMLAQTQELTKPGTIPQSSPSAPGRPVTPPKAQGVAPAAPPAAQGQPPSTPGRPVAPPAAQSAPPAAPPAAQGQPPTISAGSAGRST